MSTLTEAPHILSGLAGLLNCSVPALKLLLSLVVGGCIHYSKFFKRDETKYYS